MQAVNTSHTVAIAGREAGVGFVFMCKSDVCGFSASARRFRLVVFMAILGIDAIVKSFAGTRNTGWLD